jgi:hypothetical protein
MQTSVPLKSANSRVCRVAVFALAVLASTAWTPITSASEFRAVVSLSSLADNIGFRLDRVVDDLGVATFAGPGDVNGGGFADVIAATTSIDKIDLKAVHAQTGPGNRAFTWIGPTAFWKSPTAFWNKTGELRVQAAGTSPIVMGNVDGDGAADFKIELLVHRPLEANGDRLEGPDRGIKREGNHACD